MPEVTPVENTPRNPEQIAGNLWDAYQHMQGQPGWSSAFVPELRYKLGLGVTEEFTRADADIVARNMYERYGNTESTYVKAQEFIKGELKGRTYISPGEQNILAAQMAAHYYLHYDMLGSGIMDMEYTYPGYSMPQSNFAEGATPTLQVPNTLAPFFGDTPLRLPAGYEGRPRWRRNIEQYPRTATENAYDFISDAMKRKGKPVHVFDQGRGDVWALSLLQGKYGKDIETYGIGLEMVTYDDRPVAHDVFGPAEILPPEWEGLIDVQLSHAAYEYFAFPAHALREQLRVMAPGGTAHLLLDKYDGRQLYHIEKFWKYTGDSRPPDTVYIENFERVSTQQGQADLIEEISKETGKNVAISFYKNYCHIRNA